MSKYNHFPYRAWTVVTIVSTGEHGVVRANELAGVVAVEVIGKGLYLFMSDDVMPRALARDAASYDRTTVD